MNIILFSVFVVTLVFYATSAESRQEFKGDIKVEFQIRLACKTLTRYNLDNRNLQHPVCDSALFPL